MTTLGIPAKIGFWLCVLLGVVDAVAGLVNPGPPAGADDGPPLEVIVFGALMGVITLAAAVWFARSGRRVALRVVAASRILSGITAVPAFFVSDVPAVFRAWGAATVVVTVVAVVLLMSRSRAQVATAER